MTGQALCRCTFLPVTLQAPAHLQPGLLFDDFHLLHLAMAILTFDPCPDMDPVRKANKVRKIVDLNPFYRFIVLIFFGEPLDRFFVGRNKAVATHTGIHRRYARCDRSSGGGVTVLAGDSLVTSMQLVTERNRLLGPIPRMVDRVTGCPHIPTIQTHVRTASVFCAIASNGKQYAYAQSG